MSIAKRYIEKHKFGNYTIQEPHKGLLHFVVVIPAFREENLLKLQEQLLLIAPKNFLIEVIIVHNFSEQVSPEIKEINKKLFEENLKWCKKNNATNISFYPLKAFDLPKKHAGAGLARKIGMDAAVERFEAVNNPQGIIASLDADCKLHNNYFNNLDGAFANDKITGCILNFNHEKESVKNKPGQLQAILEYELHLRYHKHALKETGYPYYHYTLGSCFAVRAETYCKYGGMNRRKAGEDFYFLQKLFPNESFAFIAEPMVYPSSRLSDRVPFGTGPKLKELTEKKASMMSHPLESFVAIGKIVTLINDPEFYTGQKSIEVLPESLINFLKEKNIKQKLAEIIKNVSSQEAFIKRFFNWFDGLMLIQFLNFYCEKGYGEKIPSLDAARHFLNISNEILDTNLIIEKFIKLDYEQKK